METSGLSVVTTPDGCVDVRLDRLVWRDLGFRLGPFAAHVDEVVVAAVAATLRLPSSGEPLRLEALEIGEVQLQGLSLRASGLPMRLPNASDPWRLDPIGRMTGTLHAFVTDAAWIVDADVTVPIRDGRLDFNRVTVSHIGPDSSMGVSRMGVYVDAPNGRTYLYQFTATRVPGARFEERGSLFGARVSNRGELALQEFVEGALCLSSLGTPLGHAPHDVGPKLDRTRLDGELRLGDGVLSAGTVQVTLAGSAQGSNRLELSAAALSEMLTIRVPSLQARDAALMLADKKLCAGEVSGALTISLGTSEPTLDAAQLMLRKLSLAHSEISP